MNIHLHIDHIVVEGMEWGARDSVAFEAQLQSRLQQLLTAQAWNTQGAADQPLALDSLQTPNFTVAGRVGGGDFGAQVARALHSGLPGISPKEQGQR